MIDTGFKLAFSMAAFVERRLSIVLFHRVLSKPDSILRDEPYIERFAEQIGWLKANFNIMPVGEAAALLYSGRLPPRALCITFDDGYRDNLFNGVPILEQYGVRATFFVTTHYMQQGMLWNDRVIAALRNWPDREIDLERHGLGRIPLPESRGQALNSLLALIKHQPYAKREAIADELFASSGASPERLMMNGEEIKRLHDAGMEIGGHTESHPILCSLSDDRAREEITRNKVMLESIIGEQIVTFAYPNGKPNQDFDVRHVAMLRACGYRYAVTTAAGTATADSDPLQIPRFTPWDHSKAKYLARMAQNYFRDASESTTARPTTD